MHVSLFFFKHKTFDIRWVKEIYKEKYNDIYSYKGETSKAYTMLDWLLEMILQVIATLHTCVPNFCLNIKCLILPHRYMIYDLLSEKSLTTIPMEFMITRNNIFGGRKSMWKRNNENYNSLALVGFID